MRGQDLFEVKHAPVDVKNHPIIWKGINKVVNGALEKIAHGCREGDFPGIFLGENPGKKKHRSNCRFFNN